MNAERRKKLYNVITFATAFDASAAEKAFTETGKLHGMLIPTPREISSSCGTAWRGEADDGEKTLQIIRECSLAYEAAEEVWLF